MFVLVLAIGCSDSVRQWPPEAPNNRQHDADDHHRRVVAVLAFLRST